ncbi:hypothetical protein OC835_005194 [Tilletia horrida]|nr:hypothetical protein OC835_005194 [Tilletia horrida]
MSASLPSSKQPEKGSASTGATVKDDSSDDSSDDRPDLRTNRRPTLDCHIRELPTNFRPDARVDLVSEDEARLWIDDNVWYQNAAWYDTEWNATLPQRYDQFFLWARDSLIYVHTKDHIPYWYYSCLVQHILDLGRLAVPRIHQRSKKPDIPDVDSLRHHVPLYDHTHSEPEMLASRALQPRMTSTGESKTIYLSDDDSESMDGLLGPAEAVFSNVAGLSTTTAPIHPRDPLKLEPLRLSRTSTLRWQAIRERVTSTSISDRKLSPDQESEDDTFENAHTTPSRSLKRKLDA